MSPWVNRGDSVCDSSHLLGVMDTFLNHFCYLSRLYMSRIGKFKNSSFYDFFLNIP